MLGLSALWKIIAATVTFAYFWDLPKRNSFVKLREILLFLALIVESSYRSSRKLYNIMYFTGKSTTIISFHTRNYTAQKSIPYYRQNPNCFKRQSVNINCWIDNTTLLWNYVSSQLSYVITRCSIKNQHFRFSSFTIQTFY